MDYIEVYKKRLNRYGLDYQSRIQGQRDRNFDDYLLKSIYRVDFWYNDIFTPATLERYKQDYTETQCYLLTRRDLDIPNGTILMIESQDGTNKPWMVWWKEEIEASGYNKYVVLKMTHLITWCDAEEKVYEQWASYSGTGRVAINDATKSAQNETAYKENNILNMFITPYTPHLVKDSYFKVSYKETETAYVVSGVDVNSTPGVLYATIDPSYIREESTESVGRSKEAANFWLSGGNQ